MEIFQNFSHYSDFSQLSSAVVSNVRFAMLYSDFSQLSSAVVSSVRFAMLFR